VVIGRVATIVLETDLTIVQVNDPEALGMTDLLLLV
jgi:hypothetical protein